MEASDKARPIELTEEEEVKAASEGRSADILGRAKPVGQSEEEARAAEAQRPAKPVDLAEEEVKAASEGKSAEIWAKREKL